MLNALSIDIEEYFQAEAFAGLAPRERWEQFPSRVLDSTRVLLKMCAKRDVKATFFVLGWIAERYPELVKEIAAQGHELACHGYDHRLVYQQTQAEFREDVRKAKGILENIIQKPVIGFRAPTFSVIKESLWALDILSEEGFCYDSSIFPIRHDRYGIPGAFRFPHKILPNKDFYEFPPSTICLGGMNLPLGGGGYLRLLPYAYSRWGIQQLNHNRHPALVYLHPWEIDPHQPRLGLKGLSAWRHYHNTNKTMERLRLLLHTVKFAPLRDVLGIPVT